MGKVIENIQLLDIDLTWVIICAAWIPELLSLENFQSKVMLCLLTFAEVDRTVGANAKEFYEPILIDIVELEAFTWVVRSRFNKSSLFHWSLSVRWRGTWWWLILTVWTLLKAAQFGVLHASLLLTYIPSIRYGCHLYAAQYLILAHVYWHEHLLWHRRIEWGWGWFRPDLLVIVLLWLKYFA